VRTLLASDWHPNLPFTLPVFNEFLSANVRRLIGNQVHIMHLRSP
jgi:hypothetical protein